MKKTKKLVALAIIFAMILQMIVVGAQPFKQGRIVDTFETFSLYSTNDEIPKGWSKIANNNGSDFGLGVRWAPKNDEPTIDGAVLIAGGSGFAYPFSETIKTGYLRVSFDMKRQRDTSVTLMAGYADGTQPNNVKNPLGDFPANANWRTEQPLLGVDSSSYTNKISSETIQGTVDEKWHKYEACIDIATGNVQLYIDGKLKGDTVSENLKKGVKYLAFYSAYGDQYWLNGFYLDNWYVKHYLTSEEMDIDTPKMKIMGSSTVSSDGGKLELAFSDAFIDDDVMLEEDFEITGASEIAVSSVLSKKENSVATLTLQEKNGNAITPGRYTLKVVDNCWTSYEVLSSKKTPINTVEFDVTGVINYDAPKYYMNENFDGYVGGVPADWRTLIDSLTPEQEAALTRSNHDGNGFALKISQENGLSSLAYDFKYPLLTGKYNIEFDIKNSGSGWYMHLLDAAMTKYNTDGNIKYIYSNIPTSISNRNDYQDIYNAYKSEMGSDFTETAWKAYIAGEESRNIRWDKWRTNVYETVVLGQKNPTGKAGATAWRAASVNGDSDANVALSNGVSSDVWTKVNVTLDLEANNMKVRIGDGEEKTVDLKDRFNRVILVDKDTLYREFAHGIGGIAFSNSAGGSLELDNIKVSSENSYNTYDAIDYTTDKDLKPISWYNITRNGDGTYGNQKLANNELTTLTDTATDVNRGLTKAAGTWVGNSVMTHKNYGNSILGHLFSTPVKGGTPFAIELDVKIPDGTVWTMGLMTETDSQSRGINGFSQKYPATGESKSNEADDWKSYLNTGILQKRDPKATDTDTKNGFGFKDLHSAVNSKITEIECVDKVWYTLKLEVIPKRLSGSNTIVGCKLTVKDRNTGVQVGVAEKEITAYAVDLMTEDIVGINFKETAGIDVTINNLKVYELTQPAVAEIVAIKAIDYNDNETELDAEITGKTKAIKVDFSIPLSDAAGNTDKNIVLKYENGTDVRCTKTVSSDRKSVMLELNEIPDTDKNVMLSVSKNTEFEKASYMTDVPTISKTFVYKASNGKIAITDFRAYEYYEDLTNDTNTVSGGWYPVTAESLIGKDLTKIKFKIKGYNIGNAQDIFVAIAGYNTNYKSMKDVNTSKLSIDKGVFEREIELGEFNGSVDELRGFLWCAESFAPLSDKLEYQYSAQSASQQ